MELFFLLAALGLAPLGLAELVFRALIRAKIAGDGVAHRLFRFVFLRRVAAGGEYEQDTQRGGNLHKHFSNSFAAISPSRIILRRSPAISATVEPIFPASAPPSRKTLSLPVK